MPEQKGLLACSFAAGCEDVTELAQATCSPLCGASKAYGRFNDAPWKHEPQCPMRVAWDRERRGYLTHSDYLGGLVCSRHGPTTKTIETTPSGAKLLKCKLCGASTWTNEEQ
jgi:hypothetical protein